MFNICAISPLLVPKMYLNISKKYVTIFNSELLRVFFIHLHTTLPIALRKRGEPQKSNEIGFFVRKIGLIYSGHIQLLAY